MHGAQVANWGSPPTYTTFPAPSPASPNETQIKILATGIHRVVRSRAAGTHYTATTLPHTPGCDGVGMTPDDKLVYIGAVIANGTYAEIINAPNNQIFPLPADADPVKVAALVNPAMSSWMAMLARCEDLPAGFSVLIMGVTSASGRAAVGLAKSLGAGRVVGVARNVATMESIEGVDEKIVLQDPVSETDFAKIGHVDVVLDYLYGAPVEHLWQSMAKWQKGKRIQYVHVGGLAGGEARLPGSVLRSNNLAIRGSGPGSWSLQELVQHMPRLLEAVVKLDKGEVRVEKFEDVEKVWGAKEDGKRIVFIP